MDVNRSEWLAIWRGLHGMPRFALLFCVAVLFAIVVMFWADAEPVLMWSVLCTVGCSAFILLGSAMIERSGRRIEGVLSGARQHPVLVLDCTGRVVWFSEAVPALFACGEEQIAGCEPWEIFFRQDEACLAFLRQAKTLAGTGCRTSASCELVGLRKGESFPVQAVCVSLFPSARGAVMQLRELKDSRQAEDQLNRNLKVEDQLAGMIHDVFLEDDPGKTMLGASIKASAAATRQSSGDFFECFAWDDDICDVVVGDVMGKGVSAAMIGVEAKGSLQRVVAGLVAGRARADGLPDVGRVIDTLRAELDDRIAARDAFVSMCYARFDFSRREVAWVDCGHPPVIHWSAREKRWELLKGLDTPIGFSVHEPVSVMRRPFGEGDVFVIYSDGLIEARDPFGELFGVELLARAVEQVADFDAEGIERHVRRRLTEFVRGPDVASDDQLLFVIRVHAEPARICRRSWQFVCPATVADLSELRDQVETVYADPLVADRGPPADGMIMRLALHEALVNILEHASRDAGAAATPVMLTVKAFDDRVEWVFSHGMPFFSPVRIPVPRDDGSQDHGYGLFIIDRAADGVRYYRNEQGESCVMMVKWFDREKAMGRRGDGGDLKGGAYEAGTI